MLQRLSVALLVLCALVGCASLSPPPIEMSHRDSLVGAGKIVQIKNTSSEPLGEIVVSLRAPSGEERTFRQRGLDGFASFEIGWKRLGGWAITEGTEIEIHCEGYTRLHSGKIE